MNSSPESTDEDRLISTSLRDRDGYQNNAIKRRNILYILFLLLGILILISIYIELLVKKEDSYFIFFNDIHIDHEYVYTKSRKDKCHKESVPNGPKFKYGQYGCECSPELKESFYENLKKIAPNPKFIVFGGDSSYTYTWNHSYKYVREDINNITQTLRKLYPKAHFILNLGNSEYDPNYGTIETDPDSFKNISNLLGDYLSSEQRQTFEKGGYYYFDFPDQNLRVISLNSVIYSQRRNLSSEKDLYGQLEWLENVMKTKYKKAVVLHIQPGVGYAQQRTSWHPEYIEKISKVFKKYQPDYLLGSHTHLDLFVPFYNMDNLNLYLLSNPALSPKHDNNPSFRLYYMNNGITDYEQYYADIKDNPEELKWELEYRFTAEYNQRDLSQDSIRSAVKLITSTSKGMWTFLQHVYSRAYQNNAFYDCMFRSFTENSFRECIATKPNAEMFLMKS